MALRNARTDYADRSRTKQMSDAQLTGFLGRKIYQAMNDEGGDLSDTRQQLFERYYGQLYGSERDGYSKFTTREVLEAVEWCMPALMRIFTSGDRVVAFDAVGPGDQERAELETDVVNHKVMKANGGDGYLALQHFIKDALMFPTCYIKAWVEEETKRSPYVVKGVPATALAELVDDEDVEILEQDSREETVEFSVTDPTTGERFPQSETIELFDLRYRRTKKRNVLRIAAVPGEEALVDNDLTSLNLDHGDFVAHRTLKSYTALVQQGYKKEDLDDVGSYEDYQWNDERTGRLFYEDEDPDAEDEDDPSMRQFWVHECYVHVDYEGTGVAQFRKVVLIGAKVFENEETDYQPLSAMSSILVPHKHNGLSLAQLVEDLQELTTTLTRQLLDNIYRINVRRKIISEDSLLEDGTTMEAMLNVQAEWIPVRGLAANAVMPEQTPSILNEILPVIQHVQQAASLRSGVAPENNVDPDVLQQATMGAFMAGMEKAGERVELIARNMAETGIKQLFRKVHQLCRMYPDIATTVKLQGQWINVDPSEWEDRTDVTVNVGLGLNNKQTTAQLLIQLLEMQKEAVPTGLSDLAKIYNTLKKLVTLSGIGAPEQFFNDPKAEGFQQPEQPPPPGAILEQAQAQALGQEQQRKDVETQAKLPMEQAKLQQEGQKAQADAMTAQAAAESKRVELQLKREDQRIAWAELEVRKLEASAGIGNTEADTRLKGAQEVKVLAEAGRAGAETTRVTVEASEEMQLAKEMAANGRISESGGGEGEGGEGESEPAPAG